MLANGGPDILTVAMDFGYGSHEAFTRAFRDQFGMTPESVRAQGHLDNVNLVEAIKMDDGLFTTPALPRIEQGRLLQIAGLSGKCSHDTACSQCARAVTEEEGEQSRLLRNSEPPTDAGAAEITSALSSLRSSIPPPPQRRRGRHRRLLCRG